MDERLKKLLESRKKHQVDVRHEEVEDLEWAPKASKNVEEWATEAHSSTDSVKVSQKQEEISYARGSDGAEQSRRTKIHQPPTTQVDQSFASIPTRTSGLTTLEVSSLLPKESKRSSATRSVDVPMTAGDEEQESLRAAQDGDHTEKQQAVQEHGRAASDQKQSTTSFAAPDEIDFDIHSKAEDPGESATAAAEFPQVMYDTSTIENLETRHHVQQSSWPLPEEHNESSNVDLEWSASGESRSSHVPVDRPLTV
eukprot:753382-Hanusia_phi.AAC.6